MSKEKVVLAYSGGLDTSVCVKWLQDEKNLDVVCVCGNVGQEETGLDAKKQKALDLGLPFEDFIAEKLALKHRQYNTAMNDPEQEAKRQANALEEEAKAYRKASGN